MNDPTISVAAISKIYGNRAVPVPAVRKADFSCVAGSVTAIMGPSGSGKTTLLSILGLLLKPTSGRVTIMGLDVTDLDERQLPALRRAHVGFIFQSFNLFSSLTVQENVLIALQLQKTPRAAAMDSAGAALKRVDLVGRSDFYPRDLSGGEKQRVSIARAIAADTPIILADEPTANLDSKTGLKIIDLLYQLAGEQRKTVVVVSHDLRIQKHVNRVLWMEDGVIHED
ncbi:MAG: ABC transporter ATP-binding protein [Desulfobacterales bacterium]|nr:ABC transporter ATP-binding protein [Desulfobacterales bacterium]